MSRIAIAYLAVAAALQAGVQLDGERRRWEPVTLTFDGPQASESGDPNPFRDFRLTVTFEHDASGRSLTAPGYFAADGKAGESSAEGGNQWRVHFAPPLEGEWHWTASLRAGIDVALSGDPGAGKAVPLDPSRGSFTASAGTGKGMLEYVGGHYLRWAGTGEYYLKGGADSPENFLAYADFDQTFDKDADSGSYKKVGPFIHKYQPHVRDWKQGDPSWKGGKGKGIIGALNYLASKGANSVYFLTYNLDGGDGRDTWMWSSPDVRDRFDVSKLDQWEIVFRHMDRLGIMLHVVTQETENDGNLGGGYGLNPIRKLYLRELAARYSHHAALIWNLGEENDTPDADRKQIAAYIRSQDAYRHPITVHTHNNRALTTYTRLLGNPNFEATSIQGSMRNYHREALILRARSAEAGRKWAIFGDEQQTASKGVVPDADDPGHDEPRIHALWGNLMGGGAGVEWYFGSNYAHMDINCEDFRSRDILWGQTRHALDFFRTHLRFWEMTPRDEMILSGAMGRVFAQGDQTIAVQLPAGGETRLQLAKGSYRVKWFDPRKGGALVKGSKEMVEGPGEVSIGLPPGDTDRDWVALLDRKE
ncbi:MAG: DUF5060 domain-containing protein [Bryobacteraceae bacterium]